MALPIVETRPCDHCGTPTTKTPAQTRQRRYWTCGKSCAGFMRVKSGGTASTWQPNRFRGLRESRPCAECGTFVTRYVTEKNHDQPWRCSRACGVAMLVKLPRRRTGKELPCPTCGTLVYQFPGHRQRKYCSAECARTRGRDTTWTDKPCAGCGTPIRLRPSEVRTRFCSRDCATAARFKRTVDRTHNGRPVRIDGDGYLRIYEPEHAPPSQRGWALEHRVVMAKLLARPLTTAEEVDHINGNRQDNRPENLQVLGKAAHRKKTGADARKRRMTMRDRLAEYERRYGPLE